MAYQELGNVTPVVLGGVNKETRQKNPTELEGYYVGKEQRPNKFNPKQPQNFYIFQTSNGLEGVYGKAGIDKVMKGAVLGRMTKLIATGEELDTGKGFPMKLFKAFQDAEDTIDVSAVTIPTAINEEEESITDEEDEAELVEFPPAVTTARPTHTLAKAPTKSTKLTVDELLSRRNR